MGAPRYDPTDWRLFIDSSKRSLKCVLLHIGNIFGALPIGHSVLLKENQTNMEWKSDVMLFLCSDRRSIPGAGWTGQVTVPYTSRQPRHPCLEARKPATQGSDRFYSVTEISNAGERQEDRTLVDMMSVRLQRVSVVQTGVLWGDVPDEVTNKPSRRPGQYDSPEALAADPANVTQLTKPTSQTIVSYSCASRGSDIRCQVPPTRVLFG
ncbi:hypothetical protein RRG08_057851 [Elysia crispata]|uniref:Uncharacterized protein n=1 Tax=Elysia crispata TaxID=231223 RepID=A0AAE1E8B5_9GAST|nr:hypothetical protein RRG08_057851 [Elysia crispata]